MEHQLKTNGSSIDLEKVVIKLGLIKSQQEEGSTDLTDDRNGTAMVESLKEIARVMLLDDVVDDDDDNDGEINNKDIDIVDSDCDIELTYIDIDNDQIQIMTNDDIIDSLKWCCSTSKKDYKNGMMSIKIFAKVLMNVSLSQQQVQQQLQYLSSSSDSSDRVDWNRLGEDYVADSIVSKLTIEDKQNVQDHCRHEMKKNPDSIINAAVDIHSGYSTERHNEWRKILRRQQRLLLLRHAFRCQDKVCTVTPHCSEMKILWKHIADCKNQQCTVQHCLSSRYVLTHYRRCKDEKCPACAPVREVPRKSSQRENAWKTTRVVTHNGSTLPSPLLCSIALPTEFKN